jgi:DNA polymerase II small subunit
VAEIHDVKFLVYHGRSFDDFVATMPGVDRKNPTPSMIKMLQKRHLAPIYGGRTAIAPEDVDYLVIEDVPDVFTAATCMSTDAPITATS